MEVHAQKYRRIGLGTTALADTLAILGYKYGSKEGNEFVDKLYRFISKQAYESSIMLAIEKGPFPECNFIEHIKTGFVKRMPKKIKALIEEHGIRNCALLTSAPTGTVSILSGNCSSGIEPIFAPTYERSWLEGDIRHKELIFHPLCEQFLKEGKDISHFVGAGDLSVRDHLEVQKIIQSHMDNSVSKTINMPENYPIEDMSAAWLEYLPYVKGTTFYRENSRNYIDDNGIEHKSPLTAIPLEEALKRREQEITRSETVIVDDCPNGVCDVLKHKK
jgi:ribonucleoside-diphosphate reductase alpha chain